MGGGEKGWEEHAGLTIVRLIRALITAGVAALTLIFDTS